MSVGVELVAVSKSFDGRRVLEPVSISIEPGSTVAIVGPSGCGKTTMLRLVAGLDDPSAGRVEIDGRPPALARRAKHVGYVPQSPALLPWRTVAANARLLLDVGHRRNTDRTSDPSELLAVAGLTEFADAYPHQLSGGMRQRVSLVRAIALTPSVLLLDEPFAALDEITRTEMRHLVTRICEPMRTTTLFVTHSVAEAVFVADRIVVLSSRPARVIGDVAVPLPRPRTPELEDDVDFFTLERSVRALLRAARADTADISHHDRETA